MSGLKERLNRLKKQDAPKVTKPAEPDGDGWERMGVRAEHNENGVFLLRERKYSLDYMHGDYRLGELMELAGELSAFTPYTVPACEQLLFFDTETTGLGVGAGNVPFMVGIGFFEKDLYVVQQLFIRNPSEEAAMLLYLKDKLERCTHIVSYNGRSFDWPILKNRFVLGRMPLEEKTWEQLDFLYSSRSLWKSTLPSCRLSTVEEQKLGFVRKDDVPGSLAPSLYFQYLAEKDPRLMEGVFVHNENDILSLAALAIHLGKLLAGKFSAFDYSLEELYRLVCWLDKMGAHAVAERMREEMWNRLLFGLSPVKRREQYLLLLAGCYKKQGAHQRSALLWQRYIEEKQNSFACAVEPFVELAMYYEHREKNFERAAFFAEEALNRVWKRMSLSRIDPKQERFVEELRHRIQRLRAKELAQRSKEAARQSKETSRRSEEPVQLPRMKRADRPKAMYAMESLI